MTPQQWEAAERKIVALWATGDRKQALEQIELVLLSDNADFKARALIYRGSISEDEGRLEAARHDFESAVKLLGDSSYIRYTTELSLGRACKLLRDRQASAEWYRAALRTCEDASESFSGSTAVEGLLAVRPSLSDAERDLIAKVLVRSWKVLEVPGLPNEDDVPATITVLRTYERKQ